MEETYHLLSEQEKKNISSGNDTLNNNKQIIPLSTCQKTLSFLCGCCYKTYDLTKDEIFLYTKLQSHFSRSFFSSTHNCSDAPYQRVKRLAEEVFKGDNDYIELMKRPDEQEKRTKLLNYMGFLFEQCHYDVLGVGLVMSDILSYGTSKPEFVVAVRSMVNKRQYPFGQTFGHLIRAVKLYMYLDTDSERLKHKQKGTTFTMGRKDMKHFVEYLKNKNNKKQVVYEIICDMFVRLEREMRGKHLTLYSNEYNEIQNKILLDSLKSKFII